MKFYFVKERVFESIPKANIKKTLEPIIVRNQITALMDQHCIDEKDATDKTCYNCHINDICHIGVLLHCNIKPEIKVV